MIETYLISSDFRNFVFDFAKNDSQKMLWNCFVENDSDLVKKNFMSRSL